MKSEKKVRLLIIFASLVFALSISLPFLEATWEGMRIPEAVIGPETFWSFKQHLVHGWSFPLRIVEEERWFADYWVFLTAGRGTLEAWVGPVLIFMFEAQVLTVLLAILTIFWHKLYLLVSATVLNVFTVSCMLFITQALSDEYAKTLQVGFWLALLSAALFLAVSFLSYNRGDGQPYAQANHSL